MQWKIIWKMAPKSKVDIEVVEGMLRPENLEVSLRYVLKHSTRRGSNIFIWIIMWPARFVFSRTQAPHFT